MLAAEFESTRAAHPAVDIGDHILDCAARRIDDDIGLVVRQGRVLPGLIVPVAPLHLGQDVLVGLGRAPRGEFGGAAAGADLERRRQKKLVRSIGENLGADVPALQDGARSAARRRCRATRRRRTPGSADTAEAYREISGSRMAAVTSRPLTKTRTPFPEVSSSIASDSARRSTSAASVIGS